MTRVFLDSDVILDFLLGRKPFALSAGMIFAHAERGELQLCTSTVSFLNVHSIAATQTNKGEAATLIRQLRTLVSLLPVTVQAVDVALGTEGHDLEDQVQFNCAQENQIDFLVTRNIKDYPKKGLPVMPPDVFLDTVPQLSSGND
ncbi:MAG TPA: PIN domain-containing protein [Spirochaetia bacterium]|nr:PIN domain-containing protein [Spirochaetia bacterium]